MLAFQTSWTAWSFPGAITALRKASAVPSHPLLLIIDLEECEHDISVAPPNSRCHGHRYIAPRPGPPASSNAPARRAWRPCRKCVRWPGFSLHERVDRAAPAVGVRA